MTCGASSGVAPASPAEAASQPAWRPMASYTNTLVEVSDIEATSSAASRTDTAVYLAAEPKPGQQSVTARSLSIVFGTPMQVSGESNSAANRDILSAVSAESLPPL